MNLRKKVKVLLTIWIVVSAQKSFGIQVDSQERRDFTTSEEAQTACVAAVPDNECKPRGDNIAAYIWVEVLENGAHLYYAPTHCGGLPGSGSSFTCHEHYYYFNDPACADGSCNPKENAGGEGPLTCHPVNIATGNKYYPQTDYIGRGSNPLTLTHYFNAKTSSQHWSFSYRQSLTISTDSVEATRDDGKVISFAIEGGEYIGSTLRADKLRLVGSEYQLFLSNGVIERYDVNGRLAAIDFPSGPDHQLTYSGTSVVVSNGIESLTLTLVDTSVDALISQVLLPSNETIDYVYDSVGGVSRLLSVTHSDTTGGSMTYFYEDASFPTYVTGIEDENGQRISSVTYDDDGRALSSEMGPLNSGIARTQFQYNVDGSRTLTNALGKQTTYHFAYLNGEYKMTQTEGHPTANCAAANKAYTYHTTGMLATKTDWQGNVTAYDYNERRLEIQRTEAFGTPQAKTFHTVWHPELTLATWRSEPGRLTAFTYDAQGRLTKRKTYSDQDDIDGDGLSEYFEIVYFGGIEQNGSDDFDGDGFSNAQEFADQTDPANNYSGGTAADTDGDGLPDNWEVQYFATIAFDGSSDQDEDGLSDKVEFLHGSDPTVYVFDSDNDSMFDGWEYQYFLSLNRDGVGDFDQDGLSDAQEHLSDKNPVSRIDGIKPIPAHFKYPIMGQELLY